MPDVTVHFRLDRGDVVDGQRAGLAEIEAQPVGRDQRALLGDMPAEAAPQRGVEQVGGRVIGAQLRSPLGVDGQGHGIADRDRAALDRPQVNVQLAQRLGGVGDGDRLRPSSPGCR